MDPGSLGMITVSHAQQVRVVVRRAIWGWARRHRG
jgi:hypothetical protein